MSKWIQAKKQLQQKNFREEIESLFINYTPERGHVSLIPKLVGGEEKQEAETDYNLGWHMTMLNGKLVLISHKATNFKIALYGRTGWDNSEKVLQSFCKYCYSNTELGVEAGCLTIEEFKQLSEYLQKTENEIYCLRGKCKNRFRLFVCCVGRGKNGNRTLYYTKEDKDVELVCAVRPIVELPNNVLILLEDEEYDGSTPEKGIKIGIEENAVQERIDELRKEIRETERHLQDLKDELSRLTYK